MKDYSEWFNEINYTKLDRSHGGVKLYKMILLLCMLNRGPEDWHKPVSTEKIALPFYRYLMDNESIVIASFSDKENKKYHDIYDRNYFSNLIKNNPMKFWGGNNSYKHAKFNGKQFWIDIDIEPEDMDYVYNMTKNACLDRIEHETGERFDTRIHLDEEYKYQLSQVNTLKIAETEREAYVMTRIGQGKFKNRLLERYRECPVCKVQNINLLIASHIKPWKFCNNQERLDPNNGFIFCPNHDKLFDLGFISFHNDGRIIISNKNIPSDIPKFGLSDRIQISTVPGNYAYLEWHRQTFL